MVNQPPSPFCNSSRVTAFALIVAVNIGLVRLPRFAAELFPQVGWISSFISRGGGMDQLIYNTRGGGMDQFICIKSGVGMD